MILKIIVVGELETNCYVLGCEKTGKALIIDPGDDYEKIKDCLDKDNLSPESIINTHGHLDHAAANAEFNLPVYIHKLDHGLLLSELKKLPQFSGSPGNPLPEIQLLEEGGKIKSGEIALEAIHTPGHTPGSICLKADRIIFTGDTLLHGKVGRVDIPGASEEKIIKTIKEKLFIFPDDSIIYPGHGTPSTIGAEKETLL